MTITWKTHSVLTQQQQISLLVESKWAGTCRKAEMGTHLFHLQKCAVSWYTHVHLHRPWRPWLCTGPKEQRVLHISRLSPQMWVSILMCGGGLCVHRLEIISPPRVVADERRVPLGGVDARVSGTRRTRELVQAVSLQVWVPQHGLRRTEEGDWCLFLF